MLLEGKNALVYGVGDSLGGAVAKAFAAAGAKVFATSLRRENVEKVAGEIRDAGGQVDVDQVDALDEAAVNRYVARVAAQAKTVDVSFNLINIQPLQGRALVEMSFTDFVRPVDLAMRTQFLTATAAARVMAEQRSGVILSLTATVGGIGYPRVGGFGPACCAIEGFSRNLAAELGTAGVRAINLRSAGSPDSRPFRDSGTRDAKANDSFIASLAADTMLKQLPLMSDIANAAVFLASGLAGKITGVTIDITAGTTSALNHRATTVPPTFVRK
jgi:NAD(P)-dependent dehydrogenase (short-subunit alcohol dehydrogenase family)